jgi:type III secretion protein V
MIGGGILALQAFVPGFPKFHFFFISLIVAGSGLLIAFVKEKRTTKTGLSGPSPVHLQKQIALTAPLSVEISAQEAAAVSLAQLEEHFEIIGRDFYSRTGVPFPGAKARFSGQLPQGAYQIRIYDVPLYRGRLYQDKLLVPASIDRLAQLQIKATEAEAFAGMDTAAWVDIDDQGRIETAGLPCWRASQIIANHLSKVLYKHAVEFLDVSEVDCLVDKVNQQFKTLVQQVQKTLPLQTVVEIFQYLVRENVSIRNVKSILESIVAHGAKEKNPLQLAEYARQKLRRQILHQYCDQEGTLNVVLLHPELEILLRDSLRQTPEGIFITAPNHVIENLIDKVAEIKRAPLQKLAILTSPEIRQHIRKAIEKVLPDVPVLSRSELTPEIKLKPMANIKA